MRYEQDAVQQHTSSAYGTFSYSLGEGRLLQNDNSLSAPMGEVARSAEGVNNIAQADENNNSMSLRGANATWQSTANNEILKQVRNGNKQVQNDNTTTLSYQGEGRVRYEQDAVQNHTSSAYGTFSSSSGEGRYTQNVGKKVLKSFKTTRTSMIGKIK